MSANDTFGMHEASEGYPCSQNSPSQIFIVVFKILLIFIYLFQLELSRLVFNDNDNEFIALTHPQ